MRAFANWSAGMVLLVGSSLSSCAEDKGPPKLSCGDDTAGVTPSCLVLPTGGGTGEPGEQVVERLLTVFGRRRSGMGAEAVAVTVTVGECEPVPSSCSMAGCGSEGAGGTESGSATGNGAEDAVSTCSGASKVDDRDWERIQLAPGAQGRCLSEPGRRLDCHLDPNGLLTVKVRALPPVSATGGRYIPVCVELAGQPRPWKQVAKVFVSDGADRAAGLAFVEQPLSLSAPKACSELSCADFRRKTYVLSLRAQSVGELGNASTEAGAGGSAGAPGTEGNGDATGGASAPVVADSRVRAQISIQSGGPYSKLVTGDNCANSPASTVEVSFAPGSNLSGEFSLCTTGHRIEGALLEATLRDRPGTSGFRSVSFAPAVGGVRITPWPEQNRCWVEVETCGEGLSHLRSDQGIPAGFADLDGYLVVTSSGTTPGSGGSSTGGAGGVGGDSSGGSPSVGACPSAPATPAQLTVSPYGEECVLK